MKSFFLFSQLGLRVTTKPLHCYPKLNIYRTHNVFQGSFHFVYIGYLPHARYNLDAKDKELNTRENVPILLEVIFLLRETGKKQTSKYIVTNAIGKLKYIKVAGSFGGQYVE